MKKKQTIILLCAIVAAVLCACQQSAQLSAQLDEYAQIIEQAGPLPTVTPSPTPKPKTTPRPSPKATPEASPTAAPEEASEPEVSESPAPSESPKPTATPKPTPSPSPSPKATPKPISIPEPEASEFPASMFAPRPGSIPYATPMPTPEPTPVPAAPSGSGSSGVSAGGVSYSDGVGSVEGQHIVDYAKMYLGYNYVWGGESPETGFDCSGLVYYVFGQFGYSLNRTAETQAGNGVHVDNDDLQPGDILCFYKGGYIGHVGIYIGNGEYIHSQDSNTGVVISPLSERTGGWEARRIV